MSGNIAVIYSGDLSEVAEAFSDEAVHLACRVRLLALPDGGDAHASAGHESAELRDLEWADGIAFGTPVGDGSPSPALMHFIESTEPLWSGGGLYDKVVTAFTDEPEHFAPGSVLHPVYDALYRWGAVIIGPRGFELALEALPGGDRTGDSPGVSAARLRAARYRAVRLVRLAGVLAEEHARRARMEL